MTPSARVSRDLGRPPRWRANGALAPFSASQPGPSVYVFTGGRGLPRPSAKERAHSGRARRRDAVTVGGPQRVAGGSCLRITLLRLRKLRLRTCPPPPARDPSLPGRAQASASQSAGATPSRPQLLRRAQARCFPSWPGSAWADSASVSQRCVASGLLDRAKRHSGSALVGVLGCMEGDSRAVTAACTDAGARWALLARRPALAARPQQERARQLVRRLPSGGSDSHSRQPPMLLA
jgi:hypothetical protein